MKLQDFRVGLRILAKDPVYSVVSILGLGVGLGVCLLLLGYARYCWGYNAQIPDAGHVYIVKHRDNLRVGTPWYDLAPLVLLNAARTAPGVMAAGAYVSWFPLTVEVNGELHNLKSLTVLPGFAEMMGLQVIKGDLQEALSRPDAVAITSSTAIRLFGNTEVLGKTLLLRLSAMDQNSSTARIAAILRDPPANTTIPFETLNGPNLALLPSVNRKELLGESRWLSYLLVRVRPDTPPEVVTEYLQHAADTAPSVQDIPPKMKERLGSRKVMDIKLSPLRDAYFDREVTANFFSLQVDRGNASVVSGLVAVAVLILVLAAVNYVNLATIRVIRRQREIAMRKVLGARNTRLVLQFVAESLLVSLLATAVGVLLAWIAQPVFAQLMNRDLGSILSAGNIGTALGLGLILGLLTALYPAWVAFGVRPSLMLMGRPDTEAPRSRHLRRVLSVLQVSVAMGLASFALTLSWQAGFAIDASPGFDPASLLVFDLPVGASAQDEQPRGLRAALSHQAQVAGLALSNDPVGRSKESWSTEIKHDGHEAVATDVKSVSANFFEEYGIRPVAGKLFDPATDKDTDVGPLVINAIAARQLGFASPELAIGQPVQFKTSTNDILLNKRIVGVAPEIRFYSLRETPRATAYELWESGPHGGGYAATVTVRASGSVVDAERAVREVWPQYFPNSVLQIVPAKQIYAANYADDARLAELLGFSTAISMVIAAFGVYVLASDAVQRRTKEIALRKLFGTRRRDIGKLVAQEVGGIVLLSAVIAMPLAAVAIERYLAVYTERTPLAFWSLAFALGVAVATAAFAAARQIWVAMTLKPAVALRS
jgi:putative ABC transport system permease protein